MIADTIRTLPQIWFSRHGETDWNAIGRVQGQFDTDLNAVGEVQADANGIKLRTLISNPVDFDFVASPLKRTRDTMQRIRRGMGLEPSAYRLDPLLKEVHFGDWQGFTLAEIGMVHPELLEARHRDKWNFVPPGADAESYSILAQRFTSWLEIVNQPTVCVTHGGIIRTLFWLTGACGEQEAAKMPVPQDRVLKLEAGRLSWY